MLRSTWRGLETWFGRELIIAGAAIPDPTDERGGETECVSMRHRAFPQLCSRIRRTKTRDAEGIAEAATRATMRFVELKSQAQLDPISLAVMMASAKYSAGALGVDFGFNPRPRCTNP